MGGDPWTEPGIWGGDSVISAWKAWDDIRSSDAGLMDSCDDSAWVKSENKPGWRLSNAGMLPVKLDKDAGLRDIALSEKFCVDDETWESKMEVEQIDAGGCQGLICGSCADDGEFEKSDTDVGHIEESKKEVGQRELGWSKTDLSVGCKLPELVIQYVLNWLVTWGTEEVPPCGTIPLTGLCSSVDWRLLLSKLCSWSSVATSVEQTGTPVPKSLGVLPSCCKRRLGDWASCHREWPTGCCFGSVQKAYHLAACLKVSRIEQQT